MIYQLLLLMIINECYAQNSLDYEPITYPVKTRNTTNGACPSEAQLAEDRLQISREVVALLNLGRTADYPAYSCGALRANSPSGFYWILPAIGPPAVQMYCNFNRQCGCNGSSTWTRVAFLNMSDPNEICPSNWTLITDEAPFRLCGRGRGVRGEGCLSVYYPTPATAYNRVCGRITGYTQGSTEGLQPLVSSRRLGLEENYLHGMSLTHGGVGSRQHIWSFVSANGEVGIYSPQWVCDCSNINQIWSFSTDFIGNDYFCDTGNHDTSFSGRFYPDDPLWDGAGCGRSSTCCVFNNPPFFCKTLQQSTTDKLEVRLCRGENDSDEDTPVQFLELYVQ